MIPTLTPPRTQDPEDRRRERDCPRLENSTGDGGQQAVSSTVGLASSILCSGGVRVGIRFLKMFLWFFLYGRSFLKDFSFLVFAHFYLMSSYKSKFASSLAWSRLIVYHVWILDPLYRSLNSNSCNHCPPRWLIINKTWYLLIREVLQHSAPLWQKVDEFL